MVICLAVDCKSGPGNRPKFKYISTGQKSKTCTYRKFKHHQNAKFTIPELKSKYVFHPNGN